MASAALERALKLAAVTGMRSALGPALLAQAQGHPQRQHLAAAALGELVFDKLPLVPSRDSWPSLLFRGLAGAWVASKCVEREGRGDESEQWAIPLGAAVAMGVGMIAPNLRRSLGWTTGIPQPVLGLIEDYLALRLGAEASGISMDEVEQVARETVDDLRDRFHLGQYIPPMADHGRERLSQSAGAGSM